MGRVVDPRLFRALTFVPSTPRRRQVVDVEIENWPPGAVPSTAVALEGRNGPNRDGDPLGVDGDVCGPEARRTQSSLTQVSEDAQGRAHAYWMATHVGI